jgi:transcriptional regulator with GAF, ATPase, and Fis domain
VQREPWLYIWGQDDAGRAATITDSLSAAGISTRPLHASSPPDEGLLCFHSAGPELFGFLRELSTHAARRILAVAIGEHALDSSQTWPLLQAGASDVLHWSSGAGVAHRIKARFERWRAVDEILTSPAVQSKLIGNGSVWRSTLREIVEAARFTDASILLIGESGTGKELIARLIHDLHAGTSGHALVVLDCTTIVPELSGSEFFGHERGAFTGAVTARDGAFALADGGTLFLDEAGELPLTLQTQLLRVVQEGTYKRVGGNAWQRAKFRLICATNRDLPRLVEQGQFRRDLYYRIASWVFRIPPLAKRAEDILPLARHFLATLRPGIGSPEFEPPVREFLLGRGYPGNVRDLRQLIARIGSKHVGDGAITAGDIPEDERPQAQLNCGIWNSAEFEHCMRLALSSGASLKDIGRIAAETAIRLALDEEGGNLQMAARRLGVTDRALQMRRAAQREPRNGKGSQ